MKVLAALSGGVDSAVALKRVVEAGHDVTAVHMALTADKAQTRCGSRGCCTVEDATDARRAAAMLDVPFYIWDMAETFHDRVIADFIGEYQAGRTPNPCVRCNEFVKFRELLERAEVLGFDAVCTGHYARVVGAGGVGGGAGGVGGGGGAAGAAGGGGAVELHRARCLAKDQSYVLAVMGQEALQKCIFPLGDVASKEEVRAEAAAAGLTMSNKPDSYDICFIPDGDTRGFLTRNLGEQPGEVVDVEGNVLGEHAGYYGFTVGQRKGLGVERPAADGQPRYVLEIRPQDNQVVIGAAQLLSVNAMTGTDLVWLGDWAEADGGADTASAREPIVPTHPVEVQFRAHGQTVPAQVSVGDGQIQARLLRPARAVAAGQSLVIYDGTRVLAQATISATERG